MNGCDECGWYGDAGKCSSIKKRVAGKKATVYLCPVCGAEFAVSFEEVDDEH